MANQCSERKEELFFPLDESTNESTSPLTGRKVNSIKTPKRIPKSVLRERTKYIATEGTDGIHHPVAKLTPLSKRPVSADDTAPLGEWNLASSRVASAASAAAWVLEYPLPNWYRQLRLRNGFRDNSTDAPGFDSLVELRCAVHACERLRWADSSPFAEDTHPALQALRSAVHKAEREKVNDKSLKRSKILEPDPKIHGLIKVFFFGHQQSARHFDYPCDIRADALSLYRKWIRLDCDPDIFRGIIFKFVNGQKKKKRSAMLDPEYPNKINANYIGAGDLVNGQWWPNRLAVLRDGAHGGSVAGIYGKHPDGAYSIIVAGGYLEDRDNGDELFYCGTPGYKARATKDTLLLVDNQFTGRPVRVIRTSNLPPENLYRPIVGCRYDGLYRVVSKELLDAEKAHYRFRLLRMASEEPIRYRGGEARPTQYEIEAYNRHLDLMTTV